MNKRKISAILLACSVSSMVISNIPINMSRNKVLLANNDKVKSSNDISNNVINIKNVWNWDLGSLSFDKASMQLKFRAGNGTTNPYVHKDEKSFSIKYISQNGKILKSVTINGDTNPAKQLSEAFNGFKFNYGDMIEIDNYSSAKFNISNFEGNKDYNVKGNNTFEITQNGLLKLGENLSVNPVYYSLNSNKTKISGTTIANTKVYVNVDNEIYQTESDKTGKFLVEINTKKNITAETNISVFATGQNSKNLTPILNPEIYGLVNNSINIKNVWNWDLGSLSFDLVNKELNFRQGNGTTNPYVHKDEKSFTIKYINSNGQILKSVTINGDTNPNAQLYGAFDGMKFNYGDMIEIDNYSSAKFNITNFGGDKNYTLKGNNTFKITQQGLVKVELPKVNVNSFDVLGAGNVNTGTISGVVEPNKLVTIQVDGKSFTGMSDDKGKFSIKISSENYFNINTPIILESEGRTPTTINPSLVPNLGISKSSITVSGANVGAAVSQTISFNPGTMTVNNTSIYQKIFSAQLIDGKTGKIVASSSAGNFSIFQSKNDLNGAKFKYGDIINVYETQETELSYGNLILDGKTKFDAINKFVSFKITKNGLVPVSNKNLTVDPITYSGVENMELKGHTIPNTNVNIFYENGEKTVKSDENGNFKTDISVNDAPVNTEFRIFVNSDNNETTTVKYNSKSFSVYSNKIEVINNANTPVFDINFDPAASKIVATKNPIVHNYTGIFYGQDLNIKIINPENGQIINSFVGKKINDIDGFISQINNAICKTNDIIEISYNPKFVKANVINGKKNIGNDTGKNEYFQITDTGLVSLNNKFININKLSVLGNGKITNTNVLGTVKANSKVVVNVDGKVFSGISNSNGEFNIPITCENGFTANTNIMVSSTGFIPTSITPSIDTNVTLSNSYINFYNGNLNGIASLSSSITFNPETMKFTVDNYTDNFGDGKSEYFDFNLYDKNGNEILGSKINNGQTSQVDNLLNGKFFNYGDIIGLSYNSSISKPVVLNDENIISNVTGEMEYFEITKNGLVSVSMGQKANENKVYFSNGNLILDGTIANGQNESILNSNKNLVILDSSGKIVTSANAVPTEKNNPLKLQASIKVSELSKLSKGNAYTFAFEIDNKIFPIYGSNNIENNSDYTISSNEKNQTTIVSTNENNVKINNSIDIENYMKKLTSNINKQIKVDNNDVSNVMKNESVVTDITTQMFIKTVGVKNLETFINTSQENKEFLNWLLNNETAMKEFLNGPSPDGTNLVPGQAAGTYGQALTVWSNIWNKYSNSRSGFNLKLAIATALSNATPIPAWPVSGNVGDPVERYNIFEKLNAQGGMLPVFSTLGVRDLTCVVDTIIPNSEILLMRSIIMQNHNSNININSDGLNKIAYTLNYNIFNPYTGVSVFHNGFYGQNPTILDVWKDGGVCGATGRLGTTGSQMFGLPAVQASQPGHNAFAYYNKDGVWTLGNNNDGWQGTKGTDISGWSKGINTSPFVGTYYLLYDAANTPQLKKSNEYLWLAQSNISYNEKMNAINEAIKIQPLNLKAWVDKINLMETNKSVPISEYINLETQIITTFKNYPMPMFDTLAHMKQYIMNNGTSKEYNDYIQNINNILQEIVDSTTLDKATKATAADMLKLMPSIGLVKNVTPLSESSITLNNVWDDNISNISFDTVNKTLVVKNGSSETNPYKTGENFKISLEDSNGKIIKSLTVNSSSQPQDQIYKTFNGQSFEYGDKIVIDYKKSSQITINNLLDLEGNKEQYKVDKSTTLYIQEKGLSLTKKNNIQSDNKVNSNNIYWSNNNLVINGNVDSKEVFNNTKKKMVLVNSKGKIIYSIDASSTNWYSSNKNDYSGFQIIIPNEYLSKLSSGEKYSIYMQGSDGSKTYLDTSSNEILNTKYLINSNNEGVLEISNNQYNTVKEGTGNIKSGYFNNDGYVINGDIDLKNQIINKNDFREIVLKNSNGDVIYTAKCSPTNWYSINKLNYSGFQGIIPKSILNTLKSGDDYTVSLDIISGEKTYEMPIENNGGLILNQGNDIEVSVNKNKSINLSKIDQSKVIETGSATMEYGAWANYGYVMNVKVDIGQKIPKGTAMQIVSKNDLGNIVSITPGVDINWYSNNKNNYNGLQGIITPEQITSLASKSNKLYVKIMIDGKMYETPITGKLDSSKNEIFKYEFKNINNQVNLICM